jgi:hypothetical protein
MSNPQYSKAVFYLQHQQNARKNIRFSQTTSKGIYAWVKKAELGMLAKLL